MWKIIRTSSIVLGLLWAITGLAYPLAITAIAQSLFSQQAQGSFVVAEGRVIGSRLIGQNFSKAEYFHPRPSVAGDGGYDATASGGSNAGPTSQKLLEETAKRLQTVREVNQLRPETAVPSDLVLASASGLDPHLSPEAAAVQVARVAQARGLSVDAVQEIVNQHTQPRQLGFLGEPRVNVLELNLALDALQR